MSSVKDSETYSHWEENREVNDDDNNLSFKKKRPRLKLNECLDKETEDENINETVMVKEKKKILSSSKNFGKKYMLQMGYEEGKGLGKYQDGIIEPVEASKQRGTRGFGFKGPDVSSFDPSSEVISVDEEVNWLLNHHTDTLNKKLLDSWMKIGPALESVDSKSMFCKEEIISQMFSLKNVLSSIPSKNMENGRRRSNPFESISKAIFLNRAAMKMANLDAILGRMFTEPKNSNGDNMVGPNELLYFADVCAGPGGFSEYVLYRKKWRAKGFGFTLRNDNDFSLDKFWAGPSESFEPHYGALENGDVYIPQNQTSFREHVLKFTNGKGVHFMMADGGVHIDEKFNDQELICKKLYLCQCLLALYIVRVEGHFIVKLFDLFTPFSVGLLYLMYRSFKEITIVKPNTSRPANSERYLICKWKQRDCLDIADYLFQINIKVPQFDKRRQKDDVLEVVPIDILFEDVPFYSYIVSSNERLGKKQIVALKKLAAFSENSDLKEDRQQELRQVCLEKWEIPDIARAEPKKCDPRSKCKELLGTASPGDVESETIIESINTFTKHIYSIRCWYVMIISGEKDKRTFYLGLGRNNVHKFEFGKWRKLNNTDLCLPANTLVYGELVQEYFGEGKSQRKSNAFHIIDGIFLGNEDIRHLSFMERRNACNLFAESIYKEKFPIRVKVVNSLENIKTLLSSLVLKSIKCSSSHSICFPAGEDTFWKAGGAMFVSDTKGPWHRFFSQTYKAMYLQNQKSNETIYENVVNDDQKKAEIYADFMCTFDSKMIWWWDSEVAVCEGQECNPNSNKMQARDLWNFVATNINKKVV